MAARATAPRRDRWKAGFFPLAVASRVPDAIPGFRWTDMPLAHTLWWLIAAALVRPDLILTGPDPYRAHARRREAANRLTAVL